MGNYFTEEQEKVILDLYVNKGKGQMYCAKVVGSTNVNKVKEVLKKRGIHIRNYSEVAVKSNINRAKNKNKNYFNEQSHNMAWILGFLASDGSISSSNNGIKLGLAKKDREILEKIKQEIEIENDINEYITTDGFEVAELRWTCAEHKAALNEYGITPKKTFTIKPPIKLASKYWIDYIRGYFDGDGSVNLINNNGATSLRWQICGANKKFLQWIVDVLYNEYNIPKVSIQMQMRKNPLYYFQYSTKATKQIYEILYNNSLCLERKKLYFDKIILMK